MLNISGLKGWYHLILLPGTLIRKDAAEVLSSSCTMDTMLLVSAWESRSVGYILIKGVDLIV